MQLKGWSMTWKRPGTDNNWRSALVGRVVCIRDDVWLPVFSNWNKPTRGRIKRYDGY